MSELPDLVIRHPDVSKPPSCWHLSRFLYFGSYNYNSQWVYRSINQGELGQPQLERVEFLLAIKEFFEDRLIQGYSTTTVSKYLTSIGLFIRQMEQLKRSITLDSLEESYFLFAEYLLARVQSNPPTLKVNSAYGAAATLSDIFGVILEIPVSTKLIRRTRLPYQNTSKKAIGQKAEKQNLEKTFKLGNFLVDLTAGLSIEAILGPLPIWIQVRPGLVDGNEIVVKASLKVDLRNKGACLKEHLPINQLTADSIKGSKRPSCVNLRVQAEFMIFIAQTGMNRAQAKDLCRKSLKYKPLGDSWEVRCYKKRKGGEVRFQIYKAYKPFLEQYLSFLDFFFHDSDLLFPLFDSYGNVSLTRSGLLYPKMLHSFVESYEIPWITARSLRNTRVNWLLRRSGDTNLTAEMAQHSRKVLKQKYERPSQQRAMVEVTQFWNKHDPIEKGELKASIIASQCDGLPEATIYKPNSVVEPNCVSPSGCLWCKHRRDIDTADYVWSLASLRHLKTIEASGTLSKDVEPVDIVIERLSEMLTWYKKSSSNRSEWVKEARERIAEGDYHPNWSNIIALLE